MKDEENWSLGRYIFAACYDATILALNGSNGFESFYPDRPYMSDTRTEEERAAEREEREIEKLLAAEEAFIANAKRANLPTEL